jgi:hypothetical protein
MNPKFLHAILAAAVVALAGCGKKEEPPKPAPAPAPPPAVQAPAPTPAPAGVTVSNISVGKAIGADKKVTAATDTFGKGDTLYASIDTTGTGTATLKAKWTYHRDGKTAPVKEDTQTITASGPATSEFHISKPDGWPVGDYEVEVFVDDKPAGVKKFSVK